MPAITFRIRKLWQVRRPRHRLKPHLPKWIFWDVRYETMDWKRCNLYVIERTLEWGNDAEIAELIRYYGRSKVVRVLKYKIVYLREHTIRKVCAYFSLHPEELRCYWRKWLRGGHWC
jgi:hypothetical protein